MNNTPDASVPAEPLFPEGHHPDDDNNWRRKSASVPDELVERVAPFEEIIAEAYKRGWNEACHTVSEDFEVFGWPGKFEFPHFDCVGEGCGTFMAEVWPKLAAAISPAGRVEEMREALERIVEPMGNPPEQIDGLDPEIIILWWARKAIGARLIARTALSGEGR